MDSLIIALLLLAAPTVARQQRTIPVQSPEPKVQVVVCDHYQAIHQPEKGRIVIFCWEPESTPQPLGPNTY